MFKGITQNRLTFFAPFRRPCLKSNLSLAVEIFKRKAASVVPTLSGSVFIEIVFQWPGVGRMLVDAILKRDILLVQGGVMFVAACYVLFNIAVDLLQRYLDPRIK